MVTSVEGVRSAPREQLMEQPPSPSGGGGDAPLVVREKSSTPKEKRHKKKKDLAEKRRAKIEFLRSMFQSFNVDVIESILADNNDRVEDATNELILLSEPLKRPEPRWCVVLSAMPAKSVTQKIHVVSRAQANDLFKKLSGNSYDRVKQVVFAQREWIVVVHQEKEKNLQYVGSFKTFPPPDLHEKTEAGFVITSVAFAPPEQWVVVYTKDRKHPPCSCWTCTSFPQRPVSPDKALIVACFGSSVVKSPGGYTYSEEKIALVNTLTIGKQRIISSRTFPTDEIQSAIQQEQTISFIVYGEGQWYVAANSLPYTTPPLQKVLHRPTLPLEEIEQLTKSNPPLYLQHAWYRFDDPPHRSVVSGPTREGPSGTPSLLNRWHFLDPAEVQIRGNGTEALFGKRFCTLVANVMVRRGRWYFEVEIVGKPEKIRVGWARSSEFEPDVCGGYGAGDCPCSWAFDPVRGVKGHDCEFVSYGTKLVGRDTIGLLLDMNTRELSFILNGKLLGVAYSNISSGLCPVVSAETATVRMNFGQMPFLYSHLIALDYCGLMILAEIPRLLPSRDGPSEVHLVNQWQQKEIRLMSNGLEVVSLGEWCHVCADVLVRSGKWFFECKLLSDENMQIGVIQQGWQPYGFYGSKEEEENY